MTPWKQLLRQPVRLIAVLLLLAVAAAFFSLGAGVFASAKAMMDELERNYVTIGIPTTETVDQTREYDGMTYHYEASVITGEMWEYLDQLAEEGTIIQGEYQQNFISAYCPSIQTVTSGREDGRYTPYLDDPYDRAIFVIRVVSLDEKPLDGESGVIDISLKAVIENVVRLHPDYTIRGTLQLSVQCNSQADYDALDLAPGKRYLVYGGDYSDRDLYLRTHLAEVFRCSVTDIDLSHLDYALTEEIKKSASSEFKPVATYSMNDEMFILDQDMVSQVDTCSLIAIHWNGLYSDDWPVYSVDYTEIGTSANDRYCNAYMTPLDGNLQDFLNSDEGAEWKSAMEELDIQYHTVSVIGTDLLDSMYAFHQKEAFLTEGRSFSDAEYRQGTNVCLISESTAQASGLAVGDEIELSFYWGAEPLTDIQDPGWNLQPQRYSQRVGLLGSQTYEIVGVYRQSDLWDTANYRFLPNTVFVPNASLHETCYTSRDDVFFTYVLKNGKVQELQIALEAQGYPSDILFCFDNGYSEIADTFQSFFSSSKQLFFMSCLTYFAAFLLYLVLFVNHQRRSAGLMLSLGAGKWETKRFVCRLSIFPLLASSVIGAVVGAFLMNMTVHKLLASATELLDTSLSIGAPIGRANAAGELVSLPEAAVLAAILLAVIDSAAVYLRISRMVKNSPLALLRKS